MVVILGVATQTLLAYGHARSRTWLRDVASNLADLELLQVLLPAGA